MPERLLVRVALPLPFDRTFSYRVPGGLAGKVEEGMRVLVPFGRRRLVGVVVGPDEPDSAPSGLREIAAALDPAAAVDPELLGFTRWVSEYYFSPWGQVLQAALPAALRTRVTRRVSITSAGREALDNPFTAFPPGGRRLLDRVARRGHLSLDRLWLRFGKPAPLLLDQLRRLGHLTLEEREEAEGEPAPSRKRTGRAPDASEDPATHLEPDPTPSLTPAQQAALEALEPALSGDRFRSFLLEGVTGSGKTEVYLAAARRAIGRGKGALYLVPEIGLTPLLARRLERRFPGRLAVLHSGLGDARRRSTWRRIRRGEVDLVLGTRSAVFAPHPRLGLVVVDEEQDDSYYQSESPRYHGRDAAMVRARKLGIPILLGSATPSLELVAAARRGRVERLVLPERVHRREMPEVILIDMREEFRDSGVQSLLSRRLEAELREIRGRGDQALLLLNRRGFATFLLCRACGAQILCRGCSIAMTYHQTDRRLRCHYCNRRRTVPESCPACRSPHLHLGGAGTQRLEETIRLLDPGLRIARLDRDAATGHRQAEILRRFEAREIDLLLGTQMLAKGHDFPGVTLVGVLSADSHLGRPDFRAAERTYQLLTQVAGRAGRGDLPGRVIIQAYATDHPALLAATRNEPTLFYERELRVRRLAEYPPWVALAQIRVEARGEGRAEAAARQMAVRLRAASGGEFRVLGPSPAPFARIKGAWRFQILLKGKSRRRIAAGIREAMAGAMAQPPGEVRIVVETDPRDLG